MKKKVVILSAFITPFRSGAEACSEEIAARLQGEFDVTIVTARLRGSLPHLDRLPSGVRVWRVGVGRKIDKWLYPFLAPGAVRALKPDCIHAVLESYAGLAMVFCRGTARKILTCQSTNTSLFVGLMHRSADTVTAISSVLVERAKKFGKQAMLIPNGISLKQFKEARVAHQKIEGRILFVGRLEKMKGVDTLLAALAELSSYQAVELSSLHLRIVGDGSQRSSLERLASTLGISDHVTFVGPVSPYNIAKEFAEAQVFCGLSRSEALGNVFLEAQAAGCAVVATNVGGIPDIVENEITGLLVPPNDPDAAAKAIERLLTDAALRHRLAQAGEKHVEGYDWDIIAKEYANIYNR